MALASNPPRPTASRIDPTRCPLCGESNACAMEIERATGQKQPPCWCTQLDFSAELLARVPEAARQQACICARCATKPGVKAGT